MLKNKRLADPLLRADKNLKAELGLVFDCLGGTEKKVRKSRHFAKKLHQCLYFYKKARKSRHFAKKKRINVAKKYLAK